MLHRLEVQLVTALRRHLADGQPVHLPEAGRFLWRAFVELDATRSMHMSGPNPIAYTEIEAWARLNRCPLGARHVRIIKAMDATLIEHAARKQGGDSIAGRSPHQLSAKLFDKAIG